MQGENNIIKALRLLDYFTTENPQLSFKELKSISQRYSTPLSFKFRKLRFYQKMP